MSNETTLKTLDPIGNDPRVKRVYKDDLGVWIELAPGWMSGREVASVTDTPEGRSVLHLICEASVRDLWFKYRGIKSCDCEACAMAPTYTPPAKTIAGRPMIDLPADLPNEKRALRATRAGRKSRTQDVDAIGHAGGTIHKWKCPGCGAWVKEDIARVCTGCRANRPAIVEVSSSQEPV